MNILVAYSCTKRLSMLVYNNKEQIISGTLHKDEINFALLRGNYMYLIELRIRKTHKMIIIF